MTIEMISGNHIFCVTDISYDWSRMKAAVRCNSGDGNHFIEEIDVRMIGNIHELKL